LERRINGREEKKVQLGRLRSPIPCLTLVQIINFSHNCDKKELPSERQKQKVELFIRNCITFIERIGPEKGIRMKSWKSNYRVYMLALEKYWS
jgi:hypothetical protein